MNQPLFLGLSVVLLIGLPLLGVGLAGKPIGVFIEFPPRTQFVEHAGFSWLVFVGLASVILAVLVPVLFRIGHCLLSAVPCHTVTPPPGRAFPWWGWIGLSWTLCAWVLAWTRFEWMAPVQAYTFTPLWLGYIVVVNALLWRRGGASLMLERPAAFAALFPMSAVLWWFFEYLNRFVQNWQYAGVSELNAVDYLVQASIPFSTVLPAVVSTRRLLDTLPCLSCGLDRGPAVPVRRARRGALAVLLMAAVGLMGLGVWPNALFPLVWVAPLILIVCLQVLCGRPTLFEPLRRGDWGPIWTAALAALICGVFWELWNWHSLAHWTYAIPYVDRFHIFAMPLLGYAGYLPFGLECLVIADLILNNRSSEP